MIVKHKFLKEIIKNEIIINMKLLSISEVKNR